MHRSRQLKASFQIVSWVLTLSSSICGSRLSFIGAALPALRVPRKVEFPVLIVQEGLSTLACVAGSATPASDKSEKSDKWQATAWRF